MRFLHMESFCLTDVEMVLEHIPSLHVTSAMHRRSQVVVGEVEIDIAAIVTAHNLTRRDGRGVGLREDSPLDGHGRVFYSRLARTFERSFVGFVAHEWCRGKL